MLHEDAGPDALGFLRAVVFGLCFLSVVWSPSLALLADLPRELFAAPGILSLLPEGVWDALLQREPLLALAVATLLLSAIAAVGIGPFWLVGPLAFCSFLLFDGLQKGFGGFINHAQLGLLYVALLVAISPAGDGFRVGGRRRSPLPPSAAYRFPLIGGALLLSIAYFLIGAHRIAVGGVEVFTGDALPIYLATRMVDQGWPYFQVSALLLSSPIAVFALKAGFLVTTVFEVLSPLALLRRGFRLMWLGVLVPFHFATLFTMNIFFWENLVLLAVLFTNLPGRVEGWVGGRGLRGLGDAPSGPHQ